ncbi:hypothetical protein AALP_AA7G209300 [Arabis alpina]|uniref:RING-type E3 ubiquitin transferase n=1 Tax=Arabis alpina TaxID=50452 RepID=A0A087GJI5_ARAAL|nr:hypothetical protein AALP_AA7G209300 [Arabis alpina]
MDSAIATEEVDDDEEICRICRNPGDANNPLRYPCACKGSIKFVHQDCLFQWICHSHTLHCEVCEHTVSISHVYADNAPTRLPFHEFVAGIAMKIYNLLLYFMWLSFVLSVWFLAIPLVTFWIWRLAFLRSFGEAQSLLFLSHISTTVILCDCLLGFLLSASINFILDGPALLREFLGHWREGVPFYEVVGMLDQVFHMVVNAFTVLANNLKFLGVVIFVPFTLGRVVLYHVSWLFAAARDPAVTASVHFTDTGLSLENLTLKSALTSLSHLTNEGHENGLLGQLTEMMKVNGSELNGGNNTLSGVPLPWEHCTDSICQGQFFAVMRNGSRVAFYLVLILGVFLLFLSVSPLASSLVHWVVGALYMWQISIFDDLLREVLRPGVLYFLSDPEADDLLCARETLLDVAESVSFIFILVFLPVKLAIRMAPSIFPLKIFVSDSYTEIPAAMLLFQICIAFIMGHFRIQTTIKSILRCWFTGVGWALGLTDFLLPSPEESSGQDNGNGEPGRQNRVVLQVGGPDRAMAALPAADDTNRSPGEEYEDDKEQSDSEYNFVLRIILLLLVSWVALLLFNTALIVVPVSLGRALISAIPLLPVTHGIKCNDLYALVIGSYAFWATISGARYAIEYVKSKRTSVLLNQIWKWCGIVFKSSVLLGIWVFIIPVLIGLLFELLVIVPIRVPVDETPIFLLYQDWALGHIFLKIWTWLVMLDIVLPLVDDSWIEKFERVRDDGFLRLQALWVLREILFPIVMKLLIALCVPYVLAKGLFPMLGYPLVVNSAVYRFAWIGCLSVRLFCLCAKRCHVQFRKLHKSIRDERYLVGLRLHNFGEAALAEPNPKE